MSLLGAFKGAAKGWARRHAEATRHHLKQLATQVGKAIDDGALMDLTEDEVRRANAGLLAEYGTLSRLTLGYVRSKPGCVETVRASKMLGVAVNVALFLAVLVEMTEGHANKSPYAMCELALEEVDITPLEVLLALLKKTLEGPDVQDFECFMEDVCECLEEIAGQRTLRIVDMF